MAGAFGYGVETEEISRRMGELSLFPAVRSAGGDDLIVADGTSCRHQIADGTGSGDPCRQTTGTFAEGGDLTMISKPGRAVRFAAARCMKR